MSDNAVSAASPAPSISPDLRQRLKAASLEPLWESQTAHKEELEFDNGHGWAWSDMRPIMLDIAEYSSPRVVERRVLSLLEPRPRYRGGDGTVGSLNAAMQLLKPGEQARPHRHSMNALRFVLESGGGAKTIVDGLECPMEQFDLILTPAWCWHMHVHGGAAPVIWLDVLDVLVHRVLGTERFQPGPVDVAPKQWPQDAISSPNFIPVIDYAERPYSPIFRYPWADAVKAVDAAPPRTDGTRMVRYANPLTGREGLTMIDSTLMQLEPGLTSGVDTMTADRVFCVTQGSGIAHVGGEARRFTAKDVFTVPLGRPLRLSASTEGTARLVVFSNQPLFQRLGLDNPSL